MKEHLLMNNNIYDRVGNILLKYNQDISVDFLVYTSGLTESEVDEVLHFLQRKNLIVINENQVHIKGYNRKVLEYYF